MKVYLGFRLALLSVLAGFTGAVQAGSPRIPLGFDLKLVSTKIPQGHELGLEVAAPFFPISVMIEKSEWRNCKADREPPFTQVIQRAGRHPVLVSGPQDSRQSWSCRVSFHWLGGDSTRTKLEEPCAFRLPFDASKFAQVIQGFDGSLTHKGERRHALDFGMPEGTPVRAARDGVVDYVLDDSDDQSRVEGNEVLLLHTDGTHSGYAHLKRGSVVVRPGDSVQAGSIIALSGRTGSNPRMAAHLHFEVSVPRVGGRKTLPFEIRLPGGTCRTPQEGEQI